MPPGRVGWNRTRWSSRPTVARATPPRLGLELDRWVGDGDSLGADGVERLRAAGVPVDLVDAAKDESDTELAIRAAARGRARTAIVVLGALGGARVDHALANIGLLALPALRTVPACLHHGSWIAHPRPDHARDRPGRHTPLPGPIGGTVSLLPQGDGVDGVTTHGLDTRSSTSHSPPVRHAACPTSGPRATPR